MSSTDYKSQFAAFVSSFEKTYVPLFVSSNFAYWEASLTGTASAWATHDAARRKINAFLADPVAYHTLCELVKVGSGSLSLVEKRELEVLLALYRGSQAPAEELDKLSQMSSSVEQKFNCFRAEVQGKKMADNEVLDTLKKSKDSAELERVWKAHKELGRVVAADLIKLVEARNQLANKAGFKDFYEMSLTLAEQDPAEVAKIFDQLDTMTEGMYKAHKAELDQSLSSRYNIAPTDLRPWHYQDLFFQYPPLVFGLSLDPFLSGKSLEDLAASFYKGIGLDISDLLPRSDLYPRPGKHQQAFHLSVDRTNDIRVLCNIGPGASRWMSTLLHEFMHCAYDKYIAPSLPFVLREAAHTLATEGLAMLFGRLPRKLHWLQNVAGTASSPAAEAMMKLLREKGHRAFLSNQLVFTRWAQVMYRFEKALYADPKQDLNKLWWDLVEKYQMMHRPEGRNEPDWATKVHIANSPCYYHNYMLGQLWAAQVNRKICMDVLHEPDVLAMPYAGRKEVGTFLREKVFAPGRSLRWEDMIQAATGESLTPKHYVRELELAFEGGSKAKSH